MKRPTTPMKAIRAKRLECSGDRTREVRLYHLNDCPLWPYRFGCRPSTARKQRETVAQGRDGKSIGQSPIRKKPRPSSSFLRFSGLFSADGCKPTSTASPG